MRKLTVNETADVNGDLDAICNELNGLRQNTNQYLVTQLPDQPSDTLDPYFLKVGGAELGKQFSKDLELATKLAQSKVKLKAFQYSKDGTMTVFGMVVDQVARAFLWSPGVVAPNKWTKNRYQQSGDGVSYGDSLLLSFACNLDGSLRAKWATLVNLSSNPNGTGDWSFSPKAKTSAFSCFTLTAETYRRPTYQQLCGVAEMDYGASRDGDARMGMKLKLQSL
jgi:hypothetical protein